MPRVAKKFLGVFVAVTFSIVTGLLAFGVSYFFVQHVLIHPNVVVNPPASGWKSYSNKSAGLALDYPDNYFITEKEQDGNVYVSVYSAKPTPKKPGIVFDDFSGFNNRVFHIIARSKDYVADMSKYLDFSAERKPYVINSRSWNQVKIQNLNMGVATLNQLLVLRTIENGRVYEVHFETLSPDDIQIHILNSLRFF